MVGRYAAYQDAVRAFAAELPVVPDHHDVDWKQVAAGLAIPDVDRSGLQVALTLHMTALADLLDAAHATTAGTSNGGAAAIGAGVNRSAASAVEDRVLVHERRYWWRMARAHGLNPGLSQECLTDALAAATLLGAQDQQQADALLARVPRLEGQSRDRRTQVCEWIAGLYPPSAGTPWGGIAPDRLAERFIGQYLHKNAAEATVQQAEPLLVGATEQQAIRLVTMWARAATHAIFGHHLEEALVLLCMRHVDHVALPAVGVVTQLEAPGPILAAVTAIVNDPSTTLTLLQQLDRRLPERSLILAKLAVQLATRLVAEYQRLVDQGDKAYYPRLATSLNNLSVRLGNAGEREGALAAIEEAVRVYRALAAFQPNNFRSDLAMSLNNLAVQLGTVGRWDDSLAAIEEAVAILRELTAVQPGAFRGDLAMGLNNLSVQLGALGRWSDSMAAIEEAVSVFRVLAEASPDAFNPHLAACLSNLSAQLVVAGRPKECLAAIEEAVRVYRVLADASPDAFNPDLAGSLGNLSVQLAAAGQPEECLAAIDEAVGIQRRLVAAQPNVFGHDLIASLKLMAIKLVELGRDGDAAAVIAETNAVDAQLPYRETIPSAFLDIASTPVTLLALASENILDRVSDLDELIISSARSRPVAPSTVRSADMLYRSGRQAMNAARPHEAVVLLRRALRLLGLDADSASAELRVRTLISLAYSDAEAGSFEDGVEHLHTAGSHLAEVSDLRLRAELESIIEAQHGVMLMREGRIEESVLMLGRAVAISERAFAQGVADHFALASSLLNRGLALAAWGRPVQAQRDMRRSIEITEAGLRDGSNSDALAQLMPSWSNA